MHSVTAQIEIDPRIDPHASGLTGVLEIASGLCPQLAHFTQLPSTVFSRTLCCGGSFIPHLMNALSIAQAN